MMRKYYQDKSIEYKDNTKKLWELMNDIIKKTKHSGRIIPYITIDRIKVYNRKTIANEFGKFYTNLGGNLVSNIKGSTMKPDHYLTQIPRTLNSLVLAETSATEIQKIIDGPPNKTSSGHNSISNVLLKELSTAIT